MAPRKRWQDDEEEELTGLWRVASRLPLGTLAACALYVPGVVLWAVFAIRTKDNTAAFFNSVAPVSSSTLDAATNAVLTTLITLVVGCSLIFLGAFALACARSEQTSGVVSNSCCPCAHPTPSSYYIYSIFNLGFNTIVFLVNLAIVFLLMGAFMWLVVAYAANQAIKYGVRDAASLGTSPSAQLINATRNLTTVVTLYERQINQAPQCISNSSWLSTLNSSINGILRHPDDEGLQSTVLCPYTCLNLGSFATLFKLPYNCICDQDKLQTMERTSATISTDAGVALGGLILIYFACCMLHANLTAQFVHARSDFNASVKARRRRYGVGSGGASDDPEEGLGGGGKGGGNGGGGFDGGNDPDQERRQQKLTPSSSGGKTGSGRQSRRQVAPQQFDGAGSEPFAGTAPAAQSADRTAERSGWGHSSSRDGAAAELGRTSAPLQSAGSPAALRRELASRADSDRGPSSARLATAMLGRSSYRVVSQHSGSGSASPRTAASEGGGAHWLGGGIDALLRPEDAPGPHQPRHQPGGSAGSARDILLGKVALEGATSFGAAVAAARSVQRTTTSLSASSSLAARHTPSSSQESVSAESPLPHDHHQQQQGHHHTGSAGEVTSRAPAGAQVVWRPGSASGSGRWRTIEGLEDRQAVGSVLVGAAAGAAGGPPHHQHRASWAADGGTAAAAAAAVGLGSPSPPNAADPGLSPSPVALSSSFPSPWRPSSSAPQDAGDVPPRSAPRAGPRGPSRHHHSLSASLPIGGTLSEWAEVHDPAPAPLYSPNYYGAAASAPAHPPGSLTSNTNTPSSSGAAHPGGMPSVLESGGSTASSDVGRPGSADQSRAGAPQSPMLEQDRQRGSYRSSMRKGLMVYDHYKQRQPRRSTADAGGLAAAEQQPQPEGQQQQQQQGQGQPPQQQRQGQPLDPRLELCRRYRNRVPAI